MGTPYTFERELNALRLLLGRERTFQNGYRPASQAQVIAVVIYMETFLREEDVVNREDRRNYRLDMLELILQQKVDTTYDLSAYQCSTLIDYFSRESSEYHLAPRPRRFLEDCKNAVEVSGSREPRPNSLRLEDQADPETGEMPLVP